jgi:hypothetical protein
MAKASEVGQDGICSLCKGQLNSDGSKRGGMVVAGIVSCQPTFLCTTCGGSGVVATLLGDCVADSNGALDPNAVLAQVSAALGL